MFPSDSGISINDARLKGVGRVFELENSLETLTIKLENS